MGSCDDPGRTSHWMINEDMGVEDTRTLWKVSLLQPDTGKFLKPCAKPIYRSVCEQHTKSPIEIQAGQGW